MPVPPGVLGSLWRALAAFRVGALAYLVALVVHASPGYARPAAGWVALGVAVVWTPVVALGKPAAATRGATSRLHLLVALDLLVSVALVLSTRLVDTAHHIDRGAPTLPAVWAAGAVLSAALVAGPRVGMAAGLVLAAADVVERGRLAAGTVDSIVLLLLEVGVLGYLARAAVTAEANLAAAHGWQSAAAERERIARSVHDGVLQVLALLAREDLGSAQVRSLAAEQERSLRLLVTAPQASAPASRGEGPGTTTSADLTGMLGTLAADRVVVSDPGTAVPLDAAKADELLAATRALLDNVHRHAGPDARAWVLLEDEDEAVRITIRDDGPGIPDGREQDAARAGRLGLSASVRGRLRDLGGTVTLTSTPGRGTEVELHVPR